MVLGISSAPSTIQLGPCLIFTIASSVILPLNRLCADDPNKANIITTAATPKINANFAGETDSKLNTLILLKKYITIQFFNLYGWKNSKGLILSGNENGRRSKTEIQYSC